MAIEGYRGWRVKVCNGKPTLLSLNSSWWQEEETAAFCSECSKLVPFLGAQEVKTDISPKCTCGIYACKRLLDVQMHAKFADIIGGVWLYGKVLHFDKIYRAEKAKVSRLFLPALRKYPVEVLEGLAERYQVSLELWESHSPERKMLENMRRSPEVHAKKQTPQRSRWSGCGVSRSKMGVLGDGYSY